MNQLKTIIQSTRTPGSKVKPEWYVSQGISLTACGLAACAMTLQRAYGQVSTIKDARKFHKGLGLFRNWNMHIVQSYLANEGIGSYFMDKAEPIPDNTWGIFHVDGLHIVTAHSLGNGMIEVFDSLPLVGVHIQRIEDFQERLTYNYLILDSGL